MSIWRILLGRLRRHLVYHLIIPLLVGLVFEGLVKFFYVKPSNMTQSESGLTFIVTYLFSFQTLSLGIGVVLAYCVIMWILIAKETAKRIPKEDLMCLQNTLKTASSYCGVSIVPLEEWFDPSRQVFLSRILNHKLEQLNFEHHRILLFTSNGEFEKVITELTDEHYYGRCLTYLHRDCGIPLSYIKQKDLFDILDELEEKDKKIFGYSRWTNWAIIRWLGLSPLKLDFAVVKIPDKQNTKGVEKVLRGSEKGVGLRLETSFSIDEEKAYIELLNKIKRKIYESGTTTLKPQHNFYNIMTW